MYNILKLRKNYFQLWFYLWNSRGLDENTKNSTVNSNWNNVSLLVTWLLNFIFSELIFYCLSLWEWIFFSYLLTFSRVKYQICSYLWTQKTTVIRHSCSKYVYWHHGGMNWAPLKLLCLSCNTVSKRPSLGPPLCRENLYSWTADISFSSLVLCSI